MKLTRWFSAKKPPGQIGWYDVKCRHGLFGRPPGERLWFDGKDWIYDWDGEQGFISGFGHPCDSWRGLREKG